MRKEIFCLLSALVLLFLPFAFAETSGDIDSIKAPLDKVYDLLKAIVSVVALIALTVAGAKFMLSGDDMQARENSKTMVTYAVVGLVLVWVAPMLVNYLTAPMV